MWTRKAGSLSWRTRSPLGLLALVLTTRLLARWQERIGVESSQEQRQVEMVVVVMEQEEGENADTDPELVERYSVRGEGGASEDRRR